MLQPKIDPITNLPQKNSSSLPDLMKYQQLSKRDVSSVNQNYQQQFISTTDPGSEYDFSITRGYDPDERRAEEQPIGEKLLKFFPRVANSALFSVAEGAGLLWGMGEGLVYQDATRIYDNALSRALDSAKETINDELFQVYVPPSVQNGDFWDKLTSASFWATDAADTLGFALGMLVPGQAIKALNLGGKYAKIPARFKPGWMSEITAGGINSTAAVAINTLYEAGSEARHSYIQLHDQMIDQGYSEEEAKRVAGDAASSVFQGNMAILALSNTLFERFVFKGFNANPGDEIARAARSKSKTLEEFINNLSKITTKDAAKTFAKRAVGGFLSEGFLEEGTQFAIEDFAKRRAKGEAEGDMLSGVMDTYMSNIFRNTDMDIAVFLGGLFGMGMSAPGTVSEIKGANRIFFGNEEKKVSKLRKFLGGRDIAASPGLKELYEKNVVSWHKTIDSLLKRDAEGNYVMREGKPVLDQEAFRSFIQERYNDFGSIADGLVGLMANNREKYEWGQMKTAYRVFRETLATPYGKSLLKEAIPLMSQQAAATIKEQFAPEVQDSVIASEIQGRLQTAADLAEKVLKKPFDPVVLEGGSEEQKNRFSRLIQGTREGIELESLYTESIESSFPEKDESAAEDELSPFEEAMKELDDMRKKYQDPKYIQELYDQELAAAESLEKMTVGDIVTDGENEFNITNIDEKTGTITLADANNNVIKVPIAEFDKYERVDSLETSDNFQDLDLTETDNLNAKDLVDWLNKNVSNKTDKVADYMDIANKLEAKLKTLDNNELYKEIARIDNESLRNLILNKLKKPDEDGPIVPPPNSALSDDFQGRYLVDIFFPGNIDSRTRTWEGESEEDKQNDPRKANAMRVSAFLHRNAQEDYYLKVVIDEEAEAQGFNKPLQAVIVKMEDGVAKMVNMDGVVVDNIEDALTIKVPETYEEYNKRNHEGRSRFEKAEEQAFKADKSLSILLAMSAEHEAITSAYYEAIKEGNEFLLEIKGRSTGTLSNIRRNNKKTYVDIHGVLPSTQLTMDDKGHVYIGDTRYYRRTLSKEHVDTLTNIILLGLNQSIPFNSFLMNNPLFASTITNLIFYNPVWKEDAGHIKFGPNGVQFFEGYSKDGKKKWSSPTKDRNAIAKGLAGTVYAVYPDGTKTKNYEVVYLDENNQITRTDKLTPSQYDEMVIRDLIYTYHYPEELLPNGLLNYERDNVYPHVDYNSPVSSAELNGEQQEDEENQDDNSGDEFRAVASFGPAKPGSSRIAARPADQSNSVITAHPIPNSEELQGALVIENLDKILKNITRTIGAYYEFEGTVDPDNMEEISSPILAKNADGTWFVKQKGKISFVKKNRRIDPTRSFKPHNKTKVLKDLKRMLGPEVNVEFYAGLVEQGIHGWMENAAIVLDENAEEGTHYHEAFHVFVNHVLTADERKELFKYGSEEKLAEDFRLYSMDIDNRHPLAKLFDKIITAIRSILGIPKKDRDAVKEAFAELYNGKLRRSVDLSKTSPRFYRRSSVFTNNEVDIISNSVVGQAAKNMMLHNDNAIKVNATFSKEDLVKAYNDVVKAVNTPAVKSALQARGINVIMHQRNLMNEMENIMPVVAIKLKVLGLEVDQEIEVEETEETKSWEKDDTQTSVVDSIPQRVRVLLAGLAQKNFDPIQGRRVSKFDNLLGVPTFVDPKAAFTILANELQGSLSLDDIIQRLMEKRDMLKAYHTFDFLDDLFHPKYLNVVDGKVVPTPRNHELQTEFLQAFANQPYQFNIIFKTPDSLFSMDSSKTRLRREVNALWRSTFMRNREQNAVRTENAWVHNPDLNDSEFLNRKPNMDNWDEYLDYMDYLGIHFSMFYDEDGNPVDFAIINEFFKPHFNKLKKNLSAISEWIATNPGQNIHSLTYQEGNAAYSAYSRLKDLYGEMMLVGRENQFIDLNNNTRYTVGRHTHLSTQTAEMNKALNEADRVGALNRVFFPGHSKVKEGLAEGAITEVQIETSTGLKNMRSGTSSEFHRSSYEEKLVIFLNGLVEDKYTIIRTSDNKQERVFIMKDRSGRNLSLYNGLTEFLNDVEKHFQSQVERLNAGEIKAPEGSIPLFDFIPRTIREQALAGEAVDIKPLIQEHSDKLAGDMLNTLVDRGLIDPVYHPSTGEMLGFINKTFSSLAYNELVEASEISKKVREVIRKQMLSVLEQTKMFTGDPSFYKTADKMLKRGSGWVGPRSTARTDHAYNNFLKDNFSAKRPYDGNFRMAIFSDPQGYYPFAKGAIDEADAVAFINNEFQREFSLRHGLWSFMQEAVYQYQKKGDKARMPAVYKSIYGEYQVSKGRDRGDMKIYKEDIGEKGFVIPPLKPFFFGKFDNNPGMVKTAFFNVDQMGDKVLDLSGYMSQHGLDIVSFPTAVKIGDQGPSQSLFNEEGTDITTEAPANVITASHKYLGNQVSNKPKHKTSVSTGSQQLKIFADYIFDQGKAAPRNAKVKTIKNGEIVVESIPMSEAYKQFVETHNAIHQIYKEDLLHNLGLFLRDGFWVLETSEANFIDSLVKQAEERGLSENVKSMIEDIAIYGIENTNEKIENVLFKMIDEAIRSHKTNGNAYFQHTATLARKEDNYFSSKDGVFQGSDLKFYRKGENGETLPMEIYLPWYMKGEVPEDLPIEARELYGFRIPTQDINSLDAMVVKGFLPREAGNMVIVPTEYYKKNGSDSDGDKLYIHIPNLNKKTYMPEGLVDLPDVPTRRNKLRLIKKNLAAFQEAKPILESIPELKAELDTLLDYQSDMESHEDFLEFVSSMLTSIVTGRTETAIADDIRRAFQQLDGIFNKYKLIDQYNAIKKENPLLLQSPEALQNRRMHIARSVILDESNFDKLTKPLDAKFFETIFNEFKENKPKLEFHDFYNPISMIDQTSEFMEGKDGIGAAANHRVSHVMCAIHGATLLTRHAFIGTVASPDGPFGQQINEDGQYISEILSDFVNIYVDAVSNPMISTLNLGLDTVNIAATLLRAGYGVRKVIYFLNQPVIREYLQKVKLYSSQLFAEEMTKSQARKRALEEVAVKYLQGYRPNDNGLNNEIAARTVADLKRGLEPGANSGQFNGELLSAFLDWQKAATEVSTFMRRTSHDRSNPGKNLAEFMVKYIDSGLTKEGGMHNAFVQTQGILGKDTFLGRYARDYEDIAGVVSNFSMFLNRENIHLTKKILAYFDDVNNTIGGFTQDIIINTLNNFYKHGLTYLFQTKGMASRREELLFGDNNIAVRLAEMKEMFPQNSFLKTLTPSIEPMPDFPISGIIHTRENTNGYQEDALTESWDELFEHPDPMVSEFAKDLAQAAILMYGVGTSAIGYSHLIPADYMKKMMDMYDINIGSVIPEDYLDKFIVYMDKSGLDQQVSNLKLTRQTFDAVKFVRDGDLEMGISNIAFEDDIIKEEYPDFSLKEAPKEYTVYEEVEGETVVTKKEASSTPFEMFGISRREVLPSSPRVGLVYALDNISKMLYQVFQVPMTKELQALVDKGAALAESGKKRGEFMPVLDLSKLKDTPEFKAVQKQLSENPIWNPKKDTSEVKNNLDEMDNCS